MFIGIAHRNVAILGGNQYVCSRGGDVPFYQDVAYLVLTRAAVGSLQLGLAVLGQQVALQGDVAVSCFQSCRGSAGDVASDADTAVFGLYQSSLTAAHYIHAVLGLGQGDVPVLGQDFHIALIGVFSVRRYQLAGDFNIAGGQGLEGSAGFGSGRTGEGNLAGVGLQAYRLVSSYVTIYGEGTRAGHRFALVIQGVGAQYSVAAGALDYRLTSNSAGEAHLALGFHQNIAAGGT